MPREIFEDVLARASAVRHHRSVELEEGAKENHEIIALLKVEYRNPGHGTRPAWTHPVTRFSCVCNP